MMRTIFTEVIIGNPIYTPEGLVNLGKVNWTPLSKIIGFCGQTLGSLPFFISLFILKRIFRNYQKGDIFITKNAHYYKYLGCLFFLDALLVKPINEMMLVISATFSNPPGHRYMSLSFGIPHMEALFCGILVLVISWVMKEDSFLQEEQIFTI